MTEKVRVRFAPSPTGYLHVGGVRTAIFNHLLARRLNGTFILRIEDTDRERSTDEAVDQILDSLKWLAIDIDEGPYFQSQRLELYQSHIERLLSEGKAYRCYCAADDLAAKRKQAEAAKITYTYDRACRKRDPDEDPGQRPYVIRFKSPGEVPDHFDDLIMGRMPIDSAKMDDWVLARSNGSPTYNFCVVVDDADMKISHVVRGNDHVDNTPKQMLLYQALGYPVPSFAHMPLTHGPDGSKLSKRREKEYRELGISISVQEYRNMGYLPHALVNYLARLGWSHGDQEIFSRKELEELFGLEHVGKSAGVMNPDKLKWLNAHYLKQADDAELAELVVPFLKERGIETVADDTLRRIVNPLKERAKTLAEMAQMAEYFFKAPTQYDPKGVKKWFKPIAFEVLRRVKTQLETLDITNEQAIEDAFRLLAEELTDTKLGKVAQPVRLALTGVTFSPSLFLVISILGRTESLARIERALLELENKA
ncbi:MAG: glutamate--tRNA ligase [Deltaproteobacteria bacterium]|nr:glutamate--tRNA ligase [Deltaproteobacteria bacterium]